MTAMPRRLPHLALLCATTAIAALAALGGCTGCASHKDVRDLSTGPDTSAQEPDASGAAGAPDTAPPRAESIVVAIPEAPPTPGPNEPPSSLEALVPWFSPPSLSAALGDWHAAHMDADPERATALRKKAIAAFEAIAQRSTDGTGAADSRAAPARFMAAWIESELPLNLVGRVSLAARFEQLARDWPLMADVALVKAARLYETGESLDLALMMLDRLGDPAAGVSIHRAEAIELEASLLTRLGRPDEARAHLEDIARRSPDHLTAAAWRQLAELRTDPRARQAALFELASRHPGDALGREAFEALDREALTPKMKLELGEALFEAGRFDTMRGLLVGAVKPSPEACKGWILIGRSLERTNRKKKDAAVNDRAFAHYEKALKCKGEPRADATFLGGRNRLAKGDTKKGRKLLEAHVEEFAQRSTADDAKLLLAQDEAKTTKKPATKKLLQTLRRYPTGDMADQVAWELVQPHLEKRRWDKMLDLIDEILALAPDGIPGRHAGRYAYWRARALLGLDRKDEAMAGFREVFLRHPLSWYAILAWSRLSALDPTLGPALLAEAARAPVTSPDPEAGPEVVAAATPEAEGPIDSPDTTPPEEAAVATGEATAASTPTPPSQPAENASTNAGAPPSSASPEPALAAVWKNPHFRRAVEWARLAGGRYDEPSPLLTFVERELDAVPRNARPDPATWSWLRVEALQLAGGYSRSMRIARSAQSTWPMPFPTGPAARPWRLAYPQPFAAEVSRWATERGLPPAWIWGVMRVESNFEPTAVSWANAIGLMQIILPTAQMLVRDTPHAPTRETLMRPAVAVELGTKYLAKLLDRHKVYPLASAGYNAGGGAVGKWRRQFGDVEVDEFVERIPYREAHLYAKSVTQTMARYLWLYEGQMLTLDLRPVGHPDQAAPPTE